MRAGKPARAPAVGGESYSAKHIEVLEGLEPVRRRPGMYIGGTDEKALHHLFAEVIDNSMDEALAGHATFIEVEMAADGYMTVTDNGRGIPVDPHPKFPKKSALEVIMCTLHAGGKFDSEVYETSGGLHGVGVSVVNALSEKLEVEVARQGQLYKQTFVRGKPKGGLEKLGKVNNRRGTKIRFKPDPEIFGAKAKFDPQRVFKMARAKAYLFGGVEIRWNCDKELVAGTDVPTEATFHFAERPEGIRRARGRRPDAGRARYFHRHPRQARHQGRGRMGGGLGRRRRRLRVVLLQHGADAGRRHPRIRPALRPAARPQGSRRAHRARQERGADHQRRRDERHLRDGVGVHPRAGIPGPDQGSPRHRRSQRRSSTTR